MILRPRSSRPSPASSAASEPIHFGRAQLTVGAEGLSDQFSAKSDPCKLPSADSMPAADEGPCYFRPRDCSTAATFDGELR